MQNLIIGFYGPAGAGKTFAADYLCKNNSGVYSFSNIEECLSATDLQEGDVCLIDAVQTKEEIQKVRDNNGIIFFICSQSNMTADGFNPFELAKEHDSILRNEHDGKEFKSLLTRTFRQVVKKRSGSKQ